MDFDKKKKKIRNCSGFIFLFDFSICFRKIVKIRTKITKRQILKFEISKKSVLRDVEYQ